MTCGLVAVKVHGNGARACVCGAGVGSSLAYSPSIVTVGQYFDKRRTLANGLSVAGSGVGNFAIPPLIRLCVDELGLAGALLVLSAVMLHVCLAGALLRPPHAATSQPTATVDTRQPCVLCQFTPPARHDKTVLSVSCQAVSIESRDRLAKV